MKLAKIVVLLAPVLLAACAAPPMALAPNATRVQLGKSDPGNNYELIGPVSGIDGTSCGAYGYKGSYERAVTDLRNKAAGMGGNYVQLVTISEPHRAGGCFVNEYRVSANVYRKVRDQPTIAPVPVTVTNQESMPQKLRELKKLHDDGVLSDTEYETQKARVLQQGF